MIDIIMTIQASIRLALTIDSETLFNTLSEERTIRWLYPLKGSKTCSPTGNDCPGYDTKLYPIVRLQLWRSEECEVTPLLSLLLPGPLWSRVIVPVRDPSMNQTDLFKNYSIGLCAKTKNKPLKK